MAKKKKNLIATTPPKVLPEVVTPPKVYNLDTAKKAYDARLTKEDGWLKTSINDLKESYLKMTPEEIKDFQSYVKKDYSPNITRNNIVDNMLGLERNQSLLTDLKNPNKNPLVTVEPDFIKEIKNNINKEVTSQTDYFNKAKESMFNKKGEIKDYSAYGDVINVLKNENIDSSSKHVLASSLGLEGNILPENITKKQMSDFVGKTFDGDVSNPESISKYLDNMEEYLNFGGKESAMYKDMQRLIETNGRSLQKVNKIENRLIEKEQKRINTNNTRSNKPTAKQKEKKKLEKIAKKQQKKALGDLRKKTGTEGGTFTDLFKGQKGNFFNVGMSAVGAIAEFKEGRNEGKTILGSAADAALSFVGTELLGVPASIGLGVIKGATTLGIKGAKYAIDSSRSMNNIQRFSPFADAQFQDTQQLATMRQSGMELAKMSQYNLQQTLMGTEARNLHR